MILDIYPALCVAFAAVGLTWIFTHNHLQTGIPVSVGVVAGLAVAFLMIFHLEGVVTADVAKLNPNPSQYSLMYCEDTVPYVVPSEQRDATPVPSGDQTFIRWCGG